MKRRKVYLVTDEGGAYEDSYSWPYLAFSTREAAEECARKRTERGELQRDEDWSPELDYVYSSVREVAMVEVDG